MNGDVEYDCDTRFVFSANKREQTVDTSFHFFGDSFT